jgi:hypothetical protein
MLKTLARARMQRTLVLEWAAARARISRRIDAAINSGLVR